ncbi:hypothetical protein O181_015507 [Austropuccinia psidii MF-1]|uniref:Retroviral polymerase SH3-like domain-containing protein n=1 Tax=Austropuccinia psidii MF-1 TaxID=1389203 RepID=A0A9Q3C292_9BASI|nr:hypothetical protein [Austropuccinia psidii MF-1]
MKFWGEALSMETFLCNLVPKHEYQKTPYESWQNAKPPLHRLKPFFCTVWLKIPTNYIKKKFDPKAWDGIFLAYKNEASSFFILRLMDQKIIISRHVMFDEENLPLLSYQKQLTEDVIKNFPNSTQIIEEEVQKYPNTEEGSSSTDSTSISNEDEDIF